MFECEMTVKGNGKGGNGSFKTDQTAPVSRFMVDNVHLYPKFRRHVVACDRCDPEEALRFYLSRRLSLDKFKPKPGKPWPIAGHLTGTLAKLALSYERDARKAGRSVSAALVDEFLWRSADPDLLGRHERRMSVRDLVAGVQLMMRIRTGAAPKNLGSGKLSKIWVLLHHRAAPETEQEMEDLIAIAEVMII
jgi:hypothetical protein